MAGFIPPHRQQQFLKASADFFTWWLAELLQLLPEKWRNGLAGQRSLCRLIFENGQLRVVLESQGRELPLGSTIVSDLSEPYLTDVSAEGESPTTATEQLMANIAAQNNQTFGQVVLELADEYLLIRDISLPLVSDSDISRVLGHEIDRLSPFDKASVCYSYEILQKNLQSGKLRLRLVCLERAVLEGLLTQCTGLGLRVTQAQRRVASSRGEPLSEAANLLPIDKRPLKEKVWNRTNQVMAALALALLATVLILPLWHYEKQIDVLSVEVNTLLEQSKKVRAKQARLVTTLDTRDALVKRKNRELEKINILHNLTQVIPDNTWLTRVIVRDASLEIEGESSKSSDLIEKLESEAAFYQVEFASSVTRNVRTGKERFQIKMRLSDKEVSTGASSGAQDAGQPVVTGALGHE